MHFFKVLVVGALAAVAVAQDKLQFTSAPTGAQAGQSYTLKWKGGDPNQPVTILLREGESTDLKTVATITSSATGGEYKWTVPANIPSSGSYALQIEQGSQTNYWAVGGIQGGTASASASASSSSSASSASSSSASSRSSSASASSSSSSSSASASSSSSRTGSQTSSRASRTTSASSRTSSSSSPSTTSETSSSSSSGAAAATTSAPSDSGSGAEGLKSNAALVLGAVAAIAYLG